MLTFAEKVSKFFRVFLNLRASAPEHIQIEVTNRCNLRCGMCPRFALKVPDKDMPFELFEKIIRRLPTPKILTLTGWGEPMFHPRFLDILSLAISVHPQSKIKFTTNGFLLEGALAEGLLKSPPAQINVSLDRPPMLASGKDVHPASAKLDELLRTFLKSRTGGNPKVIFQAVMTPDSDESLRQLISYAKETGADGVNLVRMDVWHNPGLTRPDLSAEKILVGKLKSLGNKLRIPVECINDQSLAVRIATRFDRRCLRLDDYAYINVDGMITPCCALPHLAMGNAAAEDFLEVWRSNKFRKFQKGYLSVCNRCDSLTHCYRTTDSEEKNNA